MIELPLVPEESAPRQCPYCDSSQITTTIEYVELPYGQPGPGQTMVPCSMPVRHCGLCGFEYTDEDGEDARQEAIDTFLATSPYSCDCGWKGAHPVRIYFGEIHCPECNKIAIVQRQQ